MDYNKNVFKNVFKDLKPNIIYMENNNIVYDNMTSKTVKLNIEFLKTLSSKVKNADLKEKADNLVQLYADRKLSQKTTAENQIRDFIKYNSFKPRKQKTINKKYDALVEKYKDEEPLSQNV